ncbi:hypothetical protein [Frigoribacterium sp. RIT-PI-h]|uniref:hypothetical protein n=1 Tax=Frigoribacterium sp. RIT-PI-h TaxID=1690245 RepID=UPI0006B8AA59|nr:hypothetical protein [Frigoribacterium sp. RIT-PI-h]KPG86528.1 hypothetical protein AEQ27_04240 [Frigoribacterium sp. RIT-PI-h]
MQSTEDKDAARVTDKGRVIGPKEALAIDSAPFNGLGKHYYQLWLRGSDSIDGLEVALAAESDRADRAEAKLREVTEYVYKYLDDPDETVEQMMRDHLEATA